MTVGQRKKFFVQNKLCLDQLRLYTEGVNAAVVDASSLVQDTIQVCAPKMELDLEIPVRKKVDPVTVIEEPTLPAQLLKSQLFQQ